jgi:glycosyltransferase involved in cell wall biosynthesis
MYQQLNLILVILSLRVGGAEKLAVRLVNGWKERNIHTTIITLNEENPLFNEILPGACELKIFPRHSRFDLSFIQPIRKIISETRPDIILTFGVYEFLIIRLAMIGLTISTKIFLSIHSMPPANNWKIPREFLFLRMLSPKDRIISVCKAQADYWSKAYGIPKKMFITIYNGVDSEYFSPTANGDLRPLIRKKYGIPDNAFVIVQVASLNSNKRQEVSIEALKVFQSIHPEINSYLLFVGGGDIKLIGGGDLNYERKIRDLSERLGLKDRIIFCGNQSDVRPYYKAADLFTLSSVSETFSIAALEAMAMGLPCVLTDTGGAHEMIIEGFNGFFVPVNNPHLLAQTWLKVFENLDCFDPVKISNMVDSRFEINACVQRYIEAFYE